jgi:hypothetical protein
MKEVAPNLEYYGQYTELFRIQVYQLITLGYQDALTRIKSVDKKDHQEPAITGFIVEAINRHRRAIDRPGWLKHYTVHDDPPLEEAGKSGRSRPRVDIAIEAPTFTGAPQYMFEAKRLKKGSHGVKKYIDGDGMGCFINGRYGREYDEAAMLGYVQSDSLEYWKTQITTRVDRDSKLLRLRLVQYDVAFPSSFPFQWSSEHDRERVNRPIKIHHILLDCLVS